MRASVCGATVEKLFCRKERKSLLTLGQVDRLFPVEHLLALPHRNLAGPASTHHPFMKALVISSLFALISALAFPAASAPGATILNPERTAHAASLLASGKVLITGGANEGAILNSALLYDPALGTFTPTGNMVMARSYHTSTLLNSGQVLITGGDLSDGKISKTAELYDPVTGTFKLVAKTMKIARDKHTANLLPDGKVLLVGGKSSDIFDPATQTFTSTVNAPSQSLQPRLRRLERRHRPDYGRLRRRPRRHGCLDLLPG